MSISGRYDGCPSPSWLETLTMSSGDGIIAVDLPWDLLHELSPMKIRSNSRPYSSSYSIVKSCVRRMSITDRRSKRNVS